jgi:hypothetical protein
MTLLRSLLDDLVARRLWPIALLLAITAVAVPVVLGGGGGAAAPVASPPAARAGGAASAAPAVEVVGPASVRGRSGKVRDPFRRPKAPSVSSAGHASGSTSTSASTSTSTSTSATRESSKAGTPAPAGAAATTRATATGAGAATAADAAAASAATVYRTRVRWGRDAKGDARGVSRLEPLGGRSHPALLYLGTTRAGARAVFLLGPDAVADGDGTCAEKTCRVIRLKAGDRTVLSVRPQDGGEARRYTLAIDAITRRVAGSARAAAKLRARVHRDGRDVLRTMIEDAATAAAIGRFRFDSALGAVVATTAP